jgi:hypothetical protein
MRKELRMAQVVYLKSMSKEDLKVEFTKEQGIVKELKDQIAGKDGLEIEVQMTLNLIFEHQINLTKIKEKLGRPQSIKVKEAL